MNSISMSRAIELESPTGLYRPMYVQCEIVLYELSSQQINEWISVSTGLKSMPSAPCE